MLEAVKLVMEVTIGQPRSRACAKPMRLVNERPVAHLVHLYLSDINDNITNKMGNEGNGIL